MHTEQKAIGDMNHWVERQYNYILHKLLKLQVSILYRLRKNSLQQFKEICGT